MAESKLLSRLSEDFLECQICLQPYRRPKVLSCLHSFCQQCLEEFLKKQEATTELDCPTCRSKTLLPGGEVAKLKDNFFVESLKDTVDVHKKLNNEDESLLCGSCETKSGAESFCTECGDFLCDECVAIHRRIKAFKGHQVIGLELLKAESDTLSKIKPRPLPPCRIHPQETLKLYCVDCSEAICQLCTVLSHKEHEYEYFADTAVKAKEDIIALLEKTEKKVGDLKNADQQARAQKAELEKNVKESVEKIKKKAEQTRRDLAALVNQRETELLDSVTTVSQTRSKEFSAAIEEIEPATVALQGAAEFGWNIVEHGSEFEIMAVSGEVSGRLKKLLQAELADITEGLPAKAYVAFEEDKTSGLAKPHLGEVKTKEFEEKPKFEFAFKFAQPASSKPSPEKEKRQDTSASQTPESSSAKGYRQQASALQNPATFLKKSQTESHKGFGDLFKTKPGSWDCEVCMVNNPGDKTNCLACSTPKPGTSAAGSTTDGGSKNLAALFKPRVYTWDCSVCMVNNPADKTACLACSTPKPGRNAQASTASISGISGSAFVFKQPSGQAAKTSGGLCLSSLSASTFRRPSGPVFGKSSSGTGVAFSFSSPAKPLDSKGFVFGRLATGFKFSPEQVIPASQASAKRPMTSLNREKIELKTGEEEEEQLFKFRAKLFRWDADSNQWKERGVGDIKILRHKTTNRSRVLMRREQVLKLCANHFITGTMSLHPNSGSDRSWVWTAVDAAEEEPKTEQFAVRFKLPETAAEFKTCFDQCVEKAKTSS